MPAVHERYYCVYLLFASSWIDGVSSCAGHLRHFRHSCGKLKNEVASLYVIASSPFSWIRIRQQFVKRQQIYALPCGRSRLFLIVIAFKTQLRGFFSTIKSYLEIVSLHCELV